MKILPKIVLAFSAAASLGAAAQTVYSGASDQERRERNREEALSNYRAGTTTTAPMARERRESVREEAREARGSVRRGAHRVAESTRRVTHKSANAARRVGHKTAVKARDFTARTEARFPAKGPKRQINPEGINPVGTNPAAQTAPSAGTTK